MSVTGTAPRTQGPSSHGQVTGRDSGPGDAQAEEELHTQGLGQACKNGLASLKESSRQHSSTYR